MSEAISPPVLGSTPPWLVRVARRQVLARLSHLAHGRLVIREGRTEHVFGAVTEDCDIDVRVEVHDPGFYRAVAFGGSIGAGEAYMNGWWCCDDLTALVRLLARNQQALAGIESGLARVALPLHRLFHRLRRNTAKGSRRNIEAHYDLGNDFYALFLDETMMYSCALFEREESTLFEASLAKIDRICRKLSLNPGDRLLEIGTGWGAFAVYAAGKYGCRVTTTTLSRQQHELATHRVREAGLADRVTVLLEDYRDLDGRFDKLVSIEMIEAVGAEYYDAFFRTCSERLEPDGLMLLQAITIAEQKFETARRSVDFIQRYIFPGSCIPSLKAMVQSVAVATDLRMVHLEDLTPHYARTLRIWRERFFANLEAVKALGYSDAFVRMWEFYLCYCEGGFLERTIGDVQLLLAKPRWRGEPALLRPLRHATE